VGFPHAQGEDFLKLRMYPSKLHLSVLRIITRHSSLSDKILGDSTFWYYFQQIVCNAGYWRELTVHSLHCAVANVVDGKTPAPAPVIPLRLTPKQRQPRQVSETRF
jgi:hypothetical protein